MLYKGFTIVSQLGGSIRLDEQPDNESIRLRVGDGPPIYLDASAWSELCNLHFRLLVCSPLAVQPTDPADYDHETT